MSIIISCFIVKEPSRFDLPVSWDWTDDWHVDSASAETVDGWVYAPDTEHLKWPKSSDPSNSSNHARQRRWIRHRRNISYDQNDQISVGILEPGDTIPLPLTGLTHPALSYVFQLRPKISDHPNEYSWSVIQERHSQTDISRRHEELSGICVSDLSESENLLFCSLSDGSSSSAFRGLWFCSSIQAKEIGKDVHSDPIHDWNIIIQSPLSLTHYLPVSSQYTICYSDVSGDNRTCSQGTLAPGRSVKIYNADLRDPLYLSLIPDGGWEAMHVCKYIHIVFFLVAGHMLLVLLPYNLLMDFLIFKEPVPVSHPTRKPSKFICLKNSFSGRYGAILDNLF